MHVAICVHTPKLGIIEYPKHTDHQPQQIKYHIHISDLQSYWHVIIHGNTRIQQTSLSLSPYYQHKTQQPRYIANDKAIPSIIAMHAKSITYHQHMSQYTANARQKQPRPLSTDTAIPSFMPIHTLQLPNFTLPIRIDPKQNGRAHCELTQPSHQSATTVHATTNPIFSCPSQAYPHKFY